MIVEVKNYIHWGLISLNHLGKLAYTIQVMVIDMASIKVAGEQVKFTHTCIPLQRITTYMPKWPLFKRTKIHNLKLLQSKLPYLLYSHASVSAHHGSVSQTVIPWKCEGLHWLFTAQCTWTALLMRGISAWKCLS